VLIMHLPARPGYAGRPSAPTGRSTPEKTDADHQGHQEHQRNFIQVRMGVIWPSKASGIFPKNTRLTTSRTYEAVTTIEIAANDSNDRVVFHMPMKDGNSAMNPEKPGIPIRDQAADDHSDPYQRQRLIIPPSSGIWRVCARS